MTAFVKQQGEARATRIDCIPDGARVKPAEKTKAGLWIVSHSETGHHHVIGGDADVMERTDNVPAGMRILYAIVREPTALRQDAATPHGEIALAPGIYEFRISREYDPFSEMARQVAD